MIVKYTEIERKQKLIRFGGNAQNLNCPFPKQLPLHPPNAIVEKKGLAQVSDAGAIEGFCDQAIAANPGPAADYKAGKVAALNFLKGQVMKLSKGRANPNLIGEILERKLK